MMKPKRKKVVKAQLENELSKLERRIQTIANHAYEIRQAIESIDRQENANAIYKSGTENSTDTRTTDQNPRESQLLNYSTTNTLLDEQPQELSSDK